MEAADILVEAAEDTPVVKTELHAGPVLRIEDLAQVCVHRRPSAACETELQTASEDSIERVSDRLFWWLEPPFGGTDGAIVIKHDRSESAFDEIVCPTRQRKRIVMTRLVPDGDPSDPAELALSRTK